MQSRGLIFSRIERPKHLVYGLLFGFTPNLLNNKQKHNTLTNDLLNNICIGMVSMQHDVKIVVTKTKQTFEWFEIFNENIYLQLLVFNIFILFETRRNMQLINKKERLAVKRTRMNIIIRRSVLFSTAS